MTSNGSAVSSKVVVVGQGYVGLPVATAAVEAGFDVVGFDVDKRRVEALQLGHSVIDDITDKRLAAASATGRYTATTDTDAIEGFEVAVISVPTPLRNEIPDMHHIEQAAQTLAVHVTPGSCVVLESTTYPGTTDELVQPILEAGSDLRAEHDFFLGYSPERIDPGNEVWTFERTPKVVAGIGPRSLKAVQSFFDQLVDQTVAVSDVRAAELCKLLENTFRHVNIALVNELAMFAHDLGINVWEVIEAADTKPFGFMKFTPGPGVGGHCLPIDPSYLSWRVRRSLGQAFRFVELANDVNDHMPDYVVRRLMFAFNDKGLSLRGRRIMLIGLAYKANTSDVRESPATMIAKRLLAFGADVVGVEPRLEPGRFTLDVPLVDYTSANIAAADAAVVLVDHDELDLALLRAHGQLVFDTRNCVPPGPNVERL